VFRADCRQTLPWDRFRVACHPPTVSERFQEAILPFASGRFEN
jgi:hypothetical protein